MPVAAFDTLKYSRALREAGIPSDQADAQASASGLALSNSLELNLQDVARKPDLNQLEARIDSKLGQLEAKIDTKLAQLESRIDIKFEKLRLDNLLVKWMVSITMGAVVAGFVRSTIVH